ncbi:MAG: SDR family oxidoreductase [Hyphomicrobiales bacterium]|nr:SDR family oxidoreductase [Hyphomicrobiales bacterium]
MFEDLSGKYTLITGASSGLGRHFARLLARHGAIVLLAARRKDALLEVRQEITLAGGTAFVVEMDVTDGNSVRAALAAIDTDIDILINNAGISTSSPAFDTDEAEWDRVLDTNLKGAFLAAQGVGRRMKQRGNGGVIVNIASILGLRVASEVSAYAASKAGFIQLTKTLALEWARYGIRVNALCPGYIGTDINRNFLASPVGIALIKRIPQRRLGQPEDLDGPLLLLCSDAGRYMTGSAIVADGGHLVTSL